MNGGRVEQVDDARTVYDRPATEFVADFIGTSNLLSLRVDRREGGTLTMDLGGGMSIVAPDPGGAERGTLPITVRPEKVCLGVEPGPGWSCIRGRIAQNVFLGSVTQLLVELQTGEMLTVHELNDDDQAARLAPGTEVTVGWALPHSYAVSESPGAAGPVEAAAR